MTVAVANKITYPSDNLSFAVAVVDSLAGTGGALPGRESSLSDKINAFSANDGHGIIMSCGSDLPLNLVFRRLENKGSLEAFLEGINKLVYDDYKKGLETAESRLREEENSEREELRRRMRDKQEAFASFGPLKPELVQEKIMAEAGPLYDQLSLRYVQKTGEVRSKHKERMHALFDVVFYDRAKNEVRFYTFTSTNRGVDELHMNSVVIGSGQDLGHARNILNLSGLPFAKDDSAKKLSMSDVVYIAVSNYMGATQNSGVGGSPQIALVSKEGVVFVPRPKACLIANLVGLQLAGNYTKRDALAFVSEILDVSLDQFLQHESTDSRLKDPKLHQSALSLNNWCEIVNAEIYG